LHRQRLCGAGTFDGNIEMSKPSTGEIDLIRELRLRHWARMNYVPAECRRETWHPIVLDEMRRRDSELAELAGDPYAGARYVPLAPTGIRQLHPAHDACPDPKLLRLPRSVESRQRIEVAGF
jgi:hypothetical protein